MFFLILQIRLSCYGAPKRCGNNACSFTERKPLYAHKIVHNIGDDLGICLQSTFISEHLNKTAVGIIGRNLAVMDDRPVEQSERMCAAPPAGSVGGIPTVCRPGITFVFLQFIKDTHILWETNCFEGSHILAAGKDIGTFHFGVDLHDRSGDELFFVKLHRREQRFQRSNKVSPNNRLVCDSRNGTCGNNLTLYNLKAFL